MSSASSKKVIYAALLVNALIAVTKFAAAILTGSSAMLSEAIHSTVDTGNQGLLLYGGRRAAKPADAQHPFGYGMELYFWTFVVAILIFAGGAGVSVYEGIEKIQHPHPVSNVVVNYVVLGLALVFELFAWMVAYREFRRTDGGRGFIAAVRRSKDPAIFTVLFEDTAAVLGLFVAFVGVYLSDTLNMPILDGIASVGIGIILAITAMLLAYECKGLLIGEGAQPAVVRGIEDIVNGDARIKQTNEVLTLHFGPVDVLLNISLDFVDTIDANDVEQAISELEASIKQQFPEITRVFIEAQSRAGHQRALRENQN
jgi:cation diffusion facilitator family transporter